MNRKPLPLWVLGLLLFGLLCASTWLMLSRHAQAQPAGTPDMTSSREVPGAGENPAPFKLWEPLTSDRYALYEKVLLCTNVLVALAGLGYALLLVGQVRNADQGTPRMQEIARAVREGANAYLYRQFRVVGVLIVVITVALFYAAKASGVLPEIAWGRAIAFLVGSTFSATVGFVGMRLATVGNLRVAAAAQTSFGQALQLGYRTGTITGMLTDGLGLLGGSVIFLIYGEHAYEALLGFGFGGTLLALFMRVGGGIYTKAADVGADLVGKLEAGIPEDDPRNAATIADNVGDNVGDCAGMAADIFESYEVTIVAAMILGIASFGHKGVIFPLAGAGHRRDRQHHQHVQREGRRQGDGGRSHEERESRLHHRLADQHRGVHRAGILLSQLHAGLLAGISASRIGLSWRHGGQRNCRLARLANIGRGGPGYAPGLDLLDRNCAGRLSQ